MSSLPVRTLALTVGVIVGFADPAAAHTVGSPDASTGTEYTITDLGSADSLLVPLAINVHDEVAFNDGSVWIDGKLDTPTLPSGTSFYIISDDSTQVMNDSGVVVGYEQDSSGNDVAAYWDPSESDSPTTIDMPATLPNGDPIDDSYLTNIDAAGEAQAGGGNGVDNGEFYIAGSKGVPTGKPQLEGYGEDGDFDYIDDLSADYELDSDYDSGTGYDYYVLQDRQTQKNDWVGQIADSWGMASDGIVVGTDKSGSGAPVEVLPDGTTTALSVNTRGGAALGVNASGTAVGYLDTEDSSTEAVVWAPNGTYKVLQSDTAGASDWDLQYTKAISDNGDIAGEGTLNGVDEDFLLRYTGAVGPTSTKVDCSPSALTPGAVSRCTATVTDTATSGKITPTGTVRFTGAPTTGSFGSSGTCTLSATSTTGISSCAVSFTPATAGSYTVTAAYGGDGEHGTSSGTAVVFAQSAKAKVKHLKVKNTTVDLSVSNAGGTAPCTLKVSLSVVETVVAGARVDAGKHKVRKTVVVSKTVTLAAGASKTVKISLNAAGRRLLAKQHSLRAKLSVTESGKTIKTQTITFKAAKTKKK